MFWNADGLNLSEYREVVRIREDDKVEVEVDEESELHDGPRIPVRPAGIPPMLTVELSANAGKAPESLTAIARIVEGSSPVYYTLGADERGCYRNVMVAWELYGPGEENYRFLRHAGSSNLGETEHLSTMRPTGRL